MPHCVWLERSALACPEDPALGRRLAAGFVALEASPNLPGLRAAVWTTPETYLRCCSVQRHKPSPTPDAAIFPECSTYLAEPAPHGRLHSHLGVAGDTGCRLHHN